MLDVAFWVNSSFLTSFKNIVALSDFWWEIYSYSNHCSFIHKCSDFPQLLSRFLLVFGFQLFNCNMFGIGFFFFNLDLLWASWIYEFVFHKIWWDFSYYCFHFFFRTRLFSWNSDGINDQQFFDIFHRSLSLLIFFNTFPLMFKLDHFYWFLLKVSDSFLCHLLSVVEPV